MKQILNIKPPLCKGSLCYAKTFFIFHKGAGTEHVNYG